MGVFFAPRLYEAFGENFYIIAGGERKKRLESRGVTINGVNYRFPIVTPEEQGEPADLILIGVKGYGFAQAIEDIRHQVGEHTLILSLLNGVDSEEQLIQAFGEEHVLYAYMRMSIVMKDGKADFDPYWGKIHFGENKNDVLSDRVLAVKEVFDHADIPYEIDPDMLKGLWFKYMCNIGENMTCALLGIPFGFFRISDSANWIRDNAMRGSGCDRAEEGNRYRGKRNSGAGCYCNDNPTREQTINPAGSGSGEADRGRDVCRQCHKDGKRAWRAHSD